MTNAGELILIPLSGDAPNGAWTPADPDAYGVDAEVLLIHQVDDGAYQPTITVARYPSAEPGDAVTIADGTVADVGPGGELLDREADDDGGYVAQVVKMNVEGRDLRLAETVLRWVAVDDSHADTCVVARLICTADQVDDVVGEFVDLVGSLQPGIG